MWFYANRIHDSHLLTWKEGVIGNTIKNTRGNVPLRELNYSGRLQYSAFQLRQDTHQLQYLIDRNGMFKIQQPPFDLTAPKVDF